MNRTPFQGLGQVVRFNRGRYAAGVAAIAVGGLAAASVGGPVGGAIAVAVGLGAWWLTASLVASHWVYDRSRLFRFDWLDACFATPPRDWVALHAGLDESSEVIARRLGGAPLGVYDFFSAVASTEPSIRRARAEERAAARAPAQRVSADALPIDAAACDAVFCVFAAHELRPAVARAALFGEMARILRPGGAIVLVEHLRDLANFAVYGPGFLHFFGRAAWRATAAQAGLRIDREVAITPFVRALILRAADDARAG